MSYVVKLVPHFASVRWCETVAELPILSVIGLRYSPRVLDDALIIRSAPVTLRLPTSTLG
jgi:hypothetical protein